MKNLIFIFLIVNIPSFAQFSTQWDTIYTGLHFNQIIKLNDDTLIAATYSGIYISGDNGYNWTQRSNDVLMNLVKDSSGRIFGYYNDHIFVSNDGGFNWVLANFVLNQGYINDLKIDDNDFLWVSTGSPAKLFKSTNAGLNWTLMYSTNYDINDIDFDSMNNIYLITFDGCLRSTDGGLNWNLFFQQYELRSIEITPSDDIFIASYMMTYLTKDYGISWLTLNGIMPSSFLAIGDDNILLFQDRVYKSTDGGNYWYNMGLFVYEPYAIKIYDIDSILFASYYGELLKYDPDGYIPPNIIKDNYIPLAVGNKWLYKGGSWSPPYSSHYIFYAEATSETIIGGRRYVYITNLGWMSYSDLDKIFYYYQDGDEYPYMDFKLPDYTLYPVRSLQNPDNIYYHKTQSGYLYQTNIHYKGYSYPYFEGMFSNSFAENLGFCSSSDDGFFGNSGHYLIQALIMDSAGTMQLYDYQYDPQIVFTPITATRDTLLNFTLTVNHHFSVDTSEYIYQGLNFMDSVSMSGFYAADSDTLPFNTVYGENIYGTKKFTFNVPIDFNLLSSNYKLNYRITARDKGIVPHLDYKPSDSTYFQMILDTTSAIDDEPFQLFSYKLYQNYPNPFNPSTTIQWELQEASDVRIILYNCLGEEITTLVNEYLSAGVHSKFITLNSEFPSGVYFYRIKAGSFVETKKMILLK